MGCGPALVAGDGAGVKPVHVAPWQLRAKWKASVIANAGRVRKNLFIIASHKQVHHLLASFGLVEEQLLDNLAGSPT